MPTIVERLPMSLQAAVCVYMFVCNACFTPSPLIRLTWNFGHASSPGDNIIIECPLLKTGTRRPDTESSLLSAKILKDMSSQN